MEFVSRWNPQIRQFECRLLRDENEILFHFRAMENSIECWETGFRIWLKEKPDKSSQLVSICEKLSLCEFPEEILQPQPEKEPVKISFLRVVCSLARVLESSRDFEGGHKLLEAIREFLRSNRILNFDLSNRKGEYSYGFHILDVPFGRRLKASEEGVVIMELWSTWLFQAKLHRENLLELLRHTDLLDEIIYQSTRLPISKNFATMLRQSYVNFLKALLKFLDETQDSEFIPFRRKKTSELCATIVKNEDSDLEEQKIYLERIFNDRGLNPLDKYDQLANVFNDLKDDAGKDQRYCPRLTSLASAIAQYYLVQYDLTRAIGPWRSINMDKRDFLLRSILAIYRLPWVYVLIAFIAALSTLLPTFLPNQWIAITAGWVASLLLIITLTSAAIGIFSLLVRFLTRQGLDYIELFLPRLLGAIVVGLSILALESTVWDVSLKLDWLNWFLVCVAAYSASLLYIYLDVHKTTRLLPLLSENGAGGPQNIRANSSSNRSVQTAWSIFFIGLFEAFAASLVVSAILAWGVLADKMDLLNSKVLLRWNEILVISTWIEPKFGLLAELQIGQIGRFFFLPKIVLLWTGLTLLIGAFAQLLWQDQQITSI